MTVLQITGDRGKTFQADGQLHDVIIARVLHRGFTSLRTVAWTAPGSHAHSHGDRNAACRGERIQSRARSKIAGLDRAGRIYEFQFVRHTSSFKYIGGVVAILSALHPSTSTNAGDHECFPPIECVVLQADVRSSVVCNNWKTNVQRCTSMSSMVQKSAGASPRNQSASNAGTTYWSPESTAPAPARWKKDTFCFLTSRDCFVLRAAVRRMRKQQQAIGSHDDQQSTP
jgi:hypothetical protein